MGSVPPGFLTAPLLPQSLQECQQALGLSYGCLDQQERQTQPPALWEASPGPLGLSARLGCGGEEREARALWLLGPGTGSSWRGSGMRVWGESAGRELVISLLKAPQDRAAENSGGCVCRRQHMQKNKKKC